MRVQCIFCFHILRIEGADSGSVNCPNCNQAVGVPKHDLAEGCVLDDFVIRHEIGSGGMATVFLARQLSMDRPVALKVLNDRFASSETFSISFLKEAKAAARLNHPHVIQALRVGRESGHLFFAMEYVDGSTLAESIRRERRLELDDALNIVQQAAEGLHAAWTEEQLIHRDVKPDNIITTSEGLAKIMDLGIAVHASEAQRVEISGTPAFMAPEQFHGRDLDCRTDIYSLGATLFNAVVGYPPFEATTFEQIARMHMAHPLQFPETEVLWVPTRIRSLLGRMLAKHPSERFQSYDELLEEIVDIRRRLSNDEQLVPNVHTVSISKYRVREERDPDAVSRRRDENLAAVAEARARKSRQADFRTTTIHEIGLLERVSTGQLAVVAAILGVVALGLGALILNNKRPPSDFANQARALLAHEPAEEEFASRMSVVMALLPPQPASEDQELFLKLRARAVEIAESELLRRQSELGSLATSLDKRVAELEKADEEMVTRVAAMQADREKLDGQLEEAKATLEELTDAQAEIRDESEALSELVSELRNEKDSFDTRYGYALQLRLIELIRQFNFSGAESLLNSSTGDSPERAAIKAAKRDEFDDARRLLQIVYDSGDRVVGSKFLDGLLVRIDGPIVTLRIPDFPDTESRVLLTTLPADDIARLAQRDWPVPDGFGVAAYRFALCWGDFQIARTMRPEDVLDSHITATINGCFARQMEEIKLYIAAGREQFARDSVRFLIQRYDREQLEKMAALFHDYSGLEVAEPDTDE